MLMILMGLGISYIFAVSVAGNTDKEVIDINKNKVITCVNGTAVGDTGLICHSYNMTDVNMTNRTFVKNLFSYDDAFELK
jgi:hypothetical protein